jgi:hypothetical protein
MTYRILFPCFLILSIVSGCSRQSKKNDAGEAPVAPVRNDLPKMLITTLDESTIDTRDLEGAVIIIFFQPDCDHCQREAKEIRKHLDAFKKYELYFVTSNQKSEVENFVKDYDLAGHSNVHFGVTTTEQILNSFGPIPAPSMYIYSDKKLTQMFNGETAIEKILLAI